MRTNYITPLRVKIELHAYGEVYDVTNDVSNWKELELVIKRDTTSGVFFQASFPFEFVLDAYDIVERIFNKYQYRAKADMYVYLLKDDWVDLPHDEHYHEPQIFNLDWMKYSKSDTKIAIATRQTSLYSILKAKSKVTYDIPVDELKEANQWNFERIELENSIKFRIASEFTKAIVRSRRYEYTLGISTEATEISVPDILYAKTVGDHIDYGSNKDTWFTELSEKTASSSIRAEVDLEAEISSNRKDHLRSVYIELIKRSLIVDSNGEETGEEYTSVKKKQIPLEGDIKGKINWQEEFDFELKKSERLFLIISYDADQVGTGNTITHAAEGYIKFYYTGIFQPEQIDLIDPKVLLQELVDRTTESKKVYTSHIDEFNLDPNNLIMLSAAESIRGIATKKNNDNEVLSQAQVHTSYRQFVEWLNTLGYEQHVIDDNVTFYKRGKGFRQDLLMMELGEHECADLKEYVNENYLYSGLQIGYKRKDIENTNVRFEFNGMHDYATDLILRDNILKLISPYRADCYGIEFLAQERGKDSTDDKADKDLFLINVKQGEEKYQTIYSHYEGNYPNDTLFNGSLNPYKLMLANQSLLGISVEQMKFAGSDSNANIVIDEQPINANYTIPSDVGLFSPIMYDIASGTLQRMPSYEMANGMVRFRYRGEIYEGYIEEISKSLAWETETTWTLYKKKG